jgi:ABC-type uncharacterized transport system ATPase subunit
MVHQHFRLVEPFGCREHALGDRAQPFVLDTARSARPSPSWASGSDCRSTRARVSDLSVGERQRVES